MIGLTIVFRRIALVRSYQYDLMNHIDHNDIHIHIHIHFHVYLCSFQMNTSRLVRQHYIDVKLKSEPKELMNEPERLFLRA